MAATGIRRKVDDLGRVVIPASIRRALNIREGDAIEVSVDGERVILTKPVDACVFCGLEEPDLESYRNRLVCPDCLGSLGVVAERARRVRGTRPEPGEAPPWQVGPATAGSGGGATSRPVPRPVRAARQDDSRPADDRRSAPVDDRRPAPVDDRRSAPADERYDPASTTAW